MAKHPSDLRDPDDPAKSFTMEDRNRLHHISQMILTASAPPGTVIHLDVCQQDDDNTEPAHLMLDCRPPIEPKYEKMIGQAIIDAFPIHGYAGECEDDTQVFYKALYKVPDYCHPKDIMHAFVEVQSILGDQHPLLFELARRAKSH